MNEIERLDKLASVYKEALAPAAAAAAALSWIAANPITAVMSLWVASGVTDYLTRSNPALANLKESLTELVGLVKGVNPTKLERADLNVLNRFVKSAESILPKIDKVLSAQNHADVQSIKDLGDFIENARYVAYNAQNVANIMDKVESWYAGMGGLFVGMFGFGLEITDVRQAKARANEVAATLGPLIGGLETELADTAKKAQRVAMQQRQQQEAVPGDQVSEFATLRLG